MNPLVKKAVLQKLTYGMWVITADAAGELEGSSVTWLSQTSFTPPLVMVAVKRDTHLEQVVRKAGCFALHLIGSKQKDVAEGFTKPTTSGGGKIGGFTFKKGPATGAPLLDGFAATLEAKVAERIDRGDHVVYLAEIVGAEQADASVEPLVLATTGWNYGG